VPYIESHQELGRHPKTKRLARLLGVSLPCAVGHLQFLWWWAMDYAQDGDLTKFDAFDIADAAGWEGDAEQFLSALIQCGIGEGAGFVERHTDGSVRLHDWDQYGGKLFEERRKNAQRVASHRSKQSAEKPSSSDRNDTPALRNAHVTRTSPVTLKERRGEESISSPLPPQQGTKDCQPQGSGDDGEASLALATAPISQALTEPKAIAFTDDIPTYAKDLLTGCPDWWEDHLRLALAGRVPNNRAAYATQLVRQWREGKNAPQAPLPPIPCSEAPGEYFDPNEAERKRRMALARSRGTLLAPRTLETLAPGERSRPN